MADFRVGVTAVCSITVKDDDGTLTDPANSMKIVINKLTPSFSEVISSTSMTKDSTGTYHYDFQTASKDKGDYEVIYTSTDGTRISDGDDTLKIV